ncbi:hypothetical protein AGMMS50256_14250 [Betaproteobacteria bacterium]|nr:hypothetical protein AGMMS50256_14250 [Betaproteobacteria bacterium]
MKKAAGNETVKEDEIMQGCVLMIIGVFFLGAWIVSGSFWYALLLTAFGGGLVACVLVFAAAGLIGLIRMIFFRRA